MMFSNIGKTLFFAILAGCISCSNNIVGQNQSLETNKVNLDVSRTNQPQDSDITTQVIQKAIDYEKFQKYYHADTNPERKPLYILRNKIMPEKPDLKKFGMAVELIDCDEIKAKNRSYIEFTEINISGNIAQIVFRYYIEGVEVNLKMEKKSSDWEITTGNLVEKKFTDETCKVK